MDFAAVLASPVEFHPLATDAATGQSTDLRSLCGTPAELRLALRPAPPCRCWRARRCNSTAADSTTPACPNPSPTAPRWPRGLPTC